ncbi:MAG: endo-1,4-beta-xylanase [Cyanobacteria bacterium P01_E01_bin.42]
MLCSRILAAFTTCSFWFLLPVVFPIFADRTLAENAETGTRGTLKEDSRPALRILASDRDFNIGAAVNVGALRDSTRYREILAREFNIITAENTMKFKPLRPQRDRFDFTASDRFVAFAQTHQMKIRGHALVWHTALPVWLTEGDWSREEAIAILENHIKTVVGRYRGRIVAWDVINEAIDDDGTFRDTFWSRAIGPEYIEIAFRTAREADPEALLFYNDFGAEEWGSKAEAIYQLVRSLQAKNIPIDGVGVQMHVSVESPLDPQKVAENMRRLAALGLRVDITEMDVRLKKPAREEDRERQAEIYQEMLEVCLAAENCNTFVTWGFSDRYSWVSGIFKGWGEALPFDSDYQPKPAYYGLQDALMTTF